MAWTDDIRPAYGTVEGKFAGVSYDSADADLVPDVQPLDGTVTFTPTVAVGRIDDTLVQILTVTRKIFGGQIVDDEQNPGVRIMSTDQPLGIADWAWTARIELDGGQKFDPITFKVPRDSVVNLTAGLVPVKSLPYQIVEGASIVDAEEDGAGHIRFTLSNGEATRWLDIPNGDKGDKGDTGDKGDRGADGVSATITMGSVTAGATADMWMTGTPQTRELHAVLPRGPKGDRGEQGLRGPAGASITRTAPGVFTIEEVVA